MIGQFAVENDATGDARDLALALCKGMGLTHVGIFESSFKGEAELNLYTEQVVADAAVEIDEEAVRLDALVRQVRHADVEQQRLAQRDRRPRRMEHTAVLERVDVALGVLARCLVSRNQHGQTHSHLW